MLLCHLHTTSRVSMGHDRLSALAMLHVHYMHRIDLLEVVDKFSKKYPRCMQQLQLHKCAAPLTLIYWDYLSTRPIYIFAFV